MSVTKISDVIAARSFRYSVARYQAAMSNLTEVADLCTEAEASGDLEGPAKTRLESFLRVASVAARKATQEVCQAIALIDPAETAGRLWSMGYVWPTRCVRWGDALFVAIRENVEDDESGDAVGDEPSLHIFNLADIPCVDLEAGEPEPMLQVSETEDDPDRVD